MRNTLSSSFALALCLGLGAAQAADSTFETNYAKAKANASTPQGAAYDALLGATYEAMPEFRTRVDVCLRANPGPHEVRGYFRFVSKTDYEVVLDPKDTFTACLAPALASPSLPPPPSVPYLNPFEFTIGD